jgi:hypothetical protein
LLDWCETKIGRWCWGVFGPQLIVSGYQLHRLYCTFPPHFFILGVMQALAGAL